MKKKGLVLFLLSALLFTACGTEKNKTEETDKLTVVTSFYPVYLLAQEIVQGAEGIRLENMAQPQTGCLHDYELSISDMKLLETADIFIINGGGMESFLEQALERYPELTVVDTSEGIALLEEEEHHHHDEEEDEHEHCCHHHHDEDEDEHEHHHEHDENCTCGCHDHDHDHHHHHHHADEVFTSWGIETPNTYSAEDIEKILTALDSGEYGAILRAKGMVPAPDGTWVYYDYVPEEHDIRSGKPEVTGKICVIGSKLDEDKLAELFHK